MTLVKWLLLSGKMFIRLSLVFIPSPDVTLLMLCKGKLLALKIVKSDNDAKQAFTELSQSWDLSEDLFRSIEKVTCSFYSSGANASDVNDLRYNLFFAKNGEIESYQLPPCKVCLRKHTMGANYQACIWRRSLRCSPSILDPVGFG